MGAVVMDASMHTPSLHHRVHVSGELVLDGVLVFACHAGSFPSIHEVIR
jgi:hypothetical protein